MPSITTPALRPLRLLRHLRRALLGTALSIAALGSAQAQTTVRVAGPLTTELIVVKYAAKQGYFKKQGLDVEVLTLNSGPAAIAAVMSGSADVGYSASVPVLNARANRQPVRIFEGFTYEDAKTGYVWLVTSSKSGIKSPKDLAGKTVAINASGSACDLAAREHVAKAGVAWDAVKKVVLPFPQIEAALQVGNADAVCAVEPFATAMKINPDIRGVKISSGMLAGQTHRSVLDVLFTSEAWGNAHKPALAGLRAGLHLAFADMAKDKTLKRRMVGSELELSPALLSLLDDQIIYGGAPLSAADIQPLIDGLARHGLMKTPYKADDVMFAAP